MSIVSPIPIKRPDNVSTISRVDKTGKPLSFSLLPFSSNDVDVDMQNNLHSVRLNGWGALTLDRFEAFQSTLFDFLHSSMTGSVSVLSDDVLYVLDGYQAVQDTIENSDSVDAGKPLDSNIDVRRKGQTKHQELSGTPRPVSFVSTNWTGEFEALIFEGVLQNGAIRSAEVTLIGDSGVDYSAGTFLKKARKKLGHEFCPGDLQEIEGAVEPFTPKIERVSFIRDGYSVEPEEAILKKTGHGAITNDPGRVELEIPNPFYQSSSKLVEAFEEMGAMSWCTESVHREMSQMVASVEKLRAFPSVDQKASGSFPMLSDSDDEFDPDIDQWEIDEMRIMMFGQRLTAGNVEVIVSPVDSW